MASIHHEYSFAFNVEVLMLLKWVKGWKSGMSQSQLITFLIETISSLWPLHFTYMSNMVSFWCQLPMLGAYPTVLTLKNFSIFKCLHDMTLVLYFFIPVNWKIVGFAPYDLQY